MVRLAWMTDIHLNFLSDTEIDKWLTDLRQESFQALVITGDIGEAQNFDDYLVRIAGRLGVPLFFVLGNHDYYHGNINSVRATARNLEDAYACINWLPAHGVVKLSADAALVGHGGWADAGYGNFLGSSIRLNDYLLIDDLADLAPLKLQRKLRSLGQEAAAILAPQLDDALATYQQLYVALHVPPFQESCWHDGKLPTDDDDYLPHFTSKALGDLLLTKADEYPDRQITVLCGHTHGSGETTVRPNLHVITAGASYGNPVIARIFDT